MTTLLEVENVSYSYRIGEPVLRDVSFSVEAGDFVAVTGPSGSGKSTLFYLLGTLAARFQGNICFLGKSYRSMSAREKAIFRNREIGFVFQQFHLLPRASVLDNIVSPAFYPYDFSRPSPKDFEKAKELANKLGIGQLLERKPQELSGGQQQRVAIARALMRDPQIILADEPTGNLDSKSTEAVMGILQDLHKEGKTIILVTHSPDVANRCSRIISFRDGQIESDKRIRPLAEVKSQPTENASDSLISALPLLTYWRSLGPAWKNIIRSKAKSLLTMLGIVLGIAAVLSTMSLGSYAKNRILQSYQSLGVNNLNFTGWSNWRRSSRDFAPSIFRYFDWEKDILPMLQVFPEIQSFSPIVQTWEPTFNYGGRSVSEHTMAMGVNEQYYYITNQMVSRGRTLSVFDLESSNPVCIIGQEIKNQLFNREDAIDKTLTVVQDGDAGEFPCRVVGVMAHQPSQTQGLQPDFYIYLPYTYMQKSLSRAWQREIHEMQLKIKSGYDPDETGKRIEGYFKTRYGKTGTFRSNSNTKVISQMRLFLNVFSALLSAVALIALLVGGVGINNMMLVNLSERLKELGLRKSLGATPSQVRALVLTESLLLCTMGGVIGLIVGFLGYHGLIYGASQIIPNMTFEWIFHTRAFLISAGAIILTGILSGLIPALRAERLEVIEALRQDQ